MTAALANYGVLSKAKVIRPDATLPDCYVVESAALAPGQAFGPVASSVPNLAAGDIVVLAQIGTTRGDQVIIAKLPPAQPVALPIGISDVTGLQSALDAKASASALAAQISATATHFATNDAAIATNATAIATNTTAINTEKTRNNTQDGQISANTSGLATTNATVAGHTASIAANGTSIAANSASITALQTSDTTQNGRLDTLESNVTYQHSAEDEFGDVLSSWPRGLCYNVQTIGNNAAYGMRMFTRRSVPIKSIRLAVQTAGVGGTATVAVYYGSALSLLTLGGSATISLTATGVRVGTLATAVAVPANSHVVLAVLPVGYTTSPKISTAETNVNVSALLNPSTALPLCPQKTIGTSWPATINITDGTWATVDAPRWISAGLS